MITCNLMGGLGNQLFQYAAGRAISLKFNTELKLDLSFLKDLLNDASKSNLPHRNLEFAKNLGCPINKNKKSPFKFTTMKKICSFLFMVMMIIIVDEQSQDK